MAIIYTPVLPAVEAVTYTFPFFLLSQADTKIAKANPTIAAGDFILFRKTAGVWSRIGNLPTNPALIGISTKVLLMTLLNTDIPAGTQAFAVMCSDAAGAEWCDLLIVKDLDEGKTVSELIQADILSDATPFAGANIDQAISDPVTVGNMETAALAQFANTDTGEVAAVAGSVAELSQCNAVGFPAGAIECTITVETPTHIPIEGVSVWISTDAAMTNIIWRGESDAFGIARDIRNQRPWLDAGTYYAWVQDDNYADSNPTTMVVS